MRLARKLAIGLAAVMLSASSAMAADPIFIPLPPAPAPAPLPVAYDWSGFHVGVHSGALIFYGGGSQAGFNFQRGNLVFGVEGRIGAVIGVGPPPLFYAGIGAKVGVARGATGNVLLYGTGAAAVGFAGGPVAAVYLFGGGVEVGVTPRVSVFGEIAGLGAFGGGGCCNGLFIGGVNFHLGK